MTVNWMKCQNNEWCRLRDLKLETVEENGVYLIWRESVPPRMIWVGQGDVANRLRDHIRGGMVARHRSYGEVYVTWASIPLQKQDGVERYFADRYPPLEGERHPDVVPIAVNDPWK